jgi:hypothetical protein
VPADPVRPGPFTEPALRGRQFTAGAGRAAVDLSGPILPVDGFTSVHDPLNARVVLLDDGVTRLALVVIDQTSVFDEQVTRTRTIMHGTAGVEPEHCVVVASHTFSAPHVLPEDRVPESDAERNTLLGAAVDDAVARAARLAVEDLRPARLGFGRGTCRVNVQRDVATSDGWWLGADEAGLADDRLGVLRVDGLDGRPIALLVNYAVQSSVTNGFTTPSGEREVSADLAGAALRHVEERHDNRTVALFLIGAAGDQAPRTAIPHPPRTEVPDPSPTEVPQPPCPPGPHASVRLLGEHLGDTILRTSAAVSTGPLTAPLRVLHDNVEVPAQKPPAGFAALRPTVQYAFEPDGTTRAPVLAVRIGDTVLACLQAELNANTGIGIRETSPFPDTCVVTMTNGAAKYMADRASYDRVTYEAMNSRYARGAAEAVAGRLTGLLTTLAETEGGGRDHAET